MEVPLELAFHNVDHSDWVEAEIRRRVDKLSRLHERLTAVRVRVDTERDSARNGAALMLHIEMSVPGHDLVVSNESRRGKPKQRETTPATVIRDAFEAAERQLLASKRPAGSQSRGAAATTGE